MLGGCTAMTSCTVRARLGLLPVHFHILVAARSRYEEMYIAGGAGLVLGEDVNMGAPLAEPETGWTDTGEAPPDRLPVNGANRCVDGRYRASRIRC